MKCCVKGSLRVKIKCLLLCTIGDAQDKKCVFVSKFVDEM